MALAKWQISKLEKAIQRLANGPASIQSEGNIDKEHYLIWVKTWLIPEIQDVLEDSKLNRNYRHTI